MGLSPVLEDPTGVGEPTFVVDLSLAKGSHFGESDLAAPTSEVGVSAEGDERGLGEPTGGIEGASLDVVLSSFGDGTDHVGDGLGVPVLTNNVAASEPNGWTSIADPSVLETSLECGQTMATATHLGGTEGLARSVVDVGGGDSIGVQSTAADRGPQPSAPKVFERTEHDLVTTSLRSTGDADSRTTARVRVSAVRAVWSRGRPGFSNYRLDTGAVNNVTCIISHRN
jgi:hypothetical protein